MIRGLNVQIYYQILPESRGHCPDGGLVDGVAGGLVEGVAGGVAVPGVPLEALLDRDRLSGLDAFLFEET